VHRPLRMAVSPGDREPGRGQHVAASASRSPRIAGRRDETWSRFPLIAILLNCLLLLVPLAAASPPDPVWIPGIYDAADADDVVVAATSLESRLEGHPLIVRPVTMVAYILPVARVGLPTPTPPRSVHSRAPPKP
jgi:hypothetical protein